MTPPPSPVAVHLVDGTFELFRCFHGAPRATNSQGREVGAARGVLATIASLAQSPEVTHLAVAFDSVVAPPGPVGRSNEELIASQAGLAAQAVRALGIAVWPSGRYQADELLSTGAAKFANDENVKQVVICSTDNDFNQCVRGDRVVVLDRIRKVVTDEATVRSRYGVSPQQIPDLLALVGDRSDGLPGVPGWGNKSAATLLARYGSIEAIPLNHAVWDVAARGAARLAESLRFNHLEALICRDLSILRTDLPMRATLEDLRWSGAIRSRVESFCDIVEDHSTIERIDLWADEHQTSRQSGD